MGRLDIIKGRIAESIIAEMFSEMGYKVIRFGYENIMPELANKDNLIKGSKSHPFSITPSSQSASPQIKAKSPAPAPVHSLNQTESV